ncbi:wnt oncogene analog 4 [Aphomia sociella]
MFSCSIITVLLILSVSIIASKNVEGSQPVLQKTVEALFTEKSQITHPGACKFFRSSPRQAKMCKRNPGLSKLLQLAKNQAIAACEEAFRYDRWNCSLVFNKKTKKNIFNKIYRETAFVHALIAASMTHIIAKGCASGDLTMCSCLGSFGKNSSWKGGGCGDDFKQGKRITRNFLEFKQSGNDQIAEVLKHDVIVGIDSMGEQLREVCKCHGFSGSCTTKTCWKRLGPFNSAMGILKKHFHHAVKQKISNYTVKRAIAPKFRKKLKVDRKKLVYLHRTPNLCISTKGRECKDRNNCATLCCGRGYVTTKKSINFRCKCRMANCCVVECDTCTQEINVYTCK